MMRSDNAEAGHGIVGKLRRASLGRLKVFKDPDSAIRRRGLPVRSAWWRAVHLWSAGEVRKRRQLAALLPPPSILSPILPSVGAAFTSGDSALALTGEAVRAANAYLDSIDLGSALGTTSGKKPYLLPLAKDYPIPKDSPMFRLALHPEIVGTVAGYFGYVPILTEVNVWYSPVLEEGTPFTGSQRFHLDNEDVTQVKVFVYLHDIDVDHSPTMYIRKDRSLPVAKRNYNDMRKDSIRIDERHLRDETVIAPYGPAGSVAMLDTSSCLHAGGRCKKARKLLVFQYLTPCSHVRNRGVHERFQFLKSPEMSDIERAVINVD